MAARASVILAALFLLASSCSPDGDAQRRFELSGTIASYDAPSRRAVVDHDEVAGFMPAMRMPFAIVGGAPPLRPGDRISATLIVTDTKSWLDDVRITGAAAAPVPGAPVTGRAAPGVPVPAFPLIDQDGRARTLHDPAGRVQVLTFTYSRCPLPDFCPLMIRHLENVRQRAAREGIGDRLALIGVTLDPAFDTPAVLRTYGTSVLKDASRFERWTLATGPVEEIDAVARFFGVRSAGEGGTITHTLATAVITHDRRIMRLFASNSWHPDELFDAVRSAIQRAAGATTK